MPYVVLLTLVSLLQIVLFTLEFDDSRVELLDLVLEIVGHEARDVATSADGVEEGLLLGLSLLLRDLAGFGGALEDHRLVSLWFDGLESSSTT